MGMMESVTQLPAQYLTTVVDFIFRPRTFFANREREPSTYGSPYAFFTTNVVLAGVVATVIGRLSSQDHSSLSRLESTAMFAVIAVVHCVIAVGVGKLAGLLLNERTDAFELLTAFCYTSIFYVPLAAFIAFVPPSLRDLDVSTVVATTIIQVIALLYLLMAMARSSTLHGRRLIAFGTVSGAIVTLLSVVAGAIVIYAIDKQALPAHDEEAHVQMNNGTPVGAITIGFRGVTGHSVQLIGAPVGAITAEWFEFGTDLKIGYSIDAKNGFGTALGLQPLTKYYFRYVAQHSGTTCFGDTKSLTTLEK
jgi:hypothetical protein